MSAEIPSSQSELPDSNTQAHRSAQSADGETARIVASGEAPWGDIVQTQVAAFSDHLQRSGVRFLPAADEQSVALLADQFAKKAAPVTESETVTEAPAQSSTQRPQQVPQNPVPSATGTPPPAAEPQPRSPAKRARSAVIGIDGSYPEPALPGENRIEILHQMSDSVAACQRCSVLVKCRKQTVFGEGNPTPRFVFMGEAPGRDEDLAGRPFVGAAGQLLTKMIGACGLSREEVYILNTIKCRPPQNRNPSAEEIEQCSEYLQKQLSVLQPEYIICLGLIAAQSLLKCDLSVGKMRGKLHAYYSSKVLVTYHPAYLLRNTGAKKAAWDDLQLMLRDARLM